MPQSPCPYCGQPHDSTDTGRCTHCNGLFEPLSQIATQLAMGPWYVRDEDRPFMPGFNTAILRQQVRAGRITANTIVRGPTTNQFWMTAANAPGLSRLMGTCHACHQAVSPTDTACPFCQADLSLPDEVDQLGLRYVDEQARREAQEQVAQGRVVPTAQPKVTGSSTSTQPRAVKGSTIVDPALLKPVEPAARGVEPVQPAATASAQATAHQVEDDEPDALADAFGEDVWQSGPVSTSRRRKRQKGVDPLVLGMSVVLLCVIALGGLILLTSGKDDPKRTANPDAVAESEPERDLVAVSRVSVPALAVIERLKTVEIPDAFSDRYRRIEGLMDRAELDKSEKRYDAAYKAYEELNALVSLLEQDIAQWQIDEQAKADAAAMRDRIARLREQSQQAQAERWAAKEWQEGQASWDQGEQLFAAGDFAQAGEAFAQAESTYLIAENKAQAGQVAGLALEALNDAMKQSAEGPLRQYANEQIEAMLELRTEADGHLNEQRYAQAEQGYNAALDALREAQQIVEMARYRKFYAFDAGFRASGLMLSAARGDGVSTAARQQLAELFEKLRILPNPAEGITTGDDVGFTVAIEPLISDARDAIRQQHGEEVQACYLIGFHASLIDQTLLTNALTDEQQKRIHQSLGTIESSAQTAGWDLTRLRPVIDELRTLNRNAKLKAEPVSTREAWQRMLGPLQSRESAPQLMQPSSENPGTTPDPELFPTRG